MDLIKSSNASYASDTVPNSPKQWLFSPNHSLLRRFWAKSRQWMRALASGAWSTAPEFSTFGKRLWAWQWLTSVTRIPLRPVTALTALLRFYGRMVQSYVCSALAKELKPFALALLHHRKQLQMPKIVSGLATRYWLVVYGLGIDSTINLLILLTPNVFILTMILIILTAAIYLLCNVWSSYSLAHKRMSL